MLKSTNIDRKKKKKKKKKKLNEKKIKHQITAYFYEIKIYLICCLQ